MALTLLSAGHAALDTRRFIAPLAHHAVADIASTSTTASNNDNNNNTGSSTTTATSSNVNADDDGGSINAKRHQQRSSNIAQATAIVSTRSFANDEETQVAAVRVLTALIRTAPLALSSLSRRACASALLDAGTIQNHFYFAYLIFVCL